MKETNASHKEKPSMTEISLENKTKQIENLMKDKQSLISQIDRLNKDIFAEKEKNRSIVHDKYKIENENVDLKRTFKENENINNLSDIKKIFSPACSENFNFNDNDKDNSIIYFDIENKKEVNQEKKIERDYVNEINEINKSYKILVIL
ncbi:MAG: hypothetical protein GW809_04365 [Bacteroidetes bacterium]|nr:hypothetical protein [Bacteroidota bacterium]